MAFAWRTDPFATAGFCPICGPGHACQTWLRSAIQRRIARPTEASTKPAWSGMPTEPSVPVSATVMAVAGVTSVRTTPGESRRTRR